jgi:hypothetical protein
MTNEERDIISQFVARIGGAPAPLGAAAGAAAGSVPATTTAPLPPVDRDADALIGQLFQRYPEATYRMTQLAFVQEQGLIQAQSRIAQMDAELQRTRQALQQAQQQPQPQQQQSGGGFFSSLFGGGRPQAAPPPNPGPWGGQQAAPAPGYAPPPPGYAPPPPQYASGYQPGMFQRSGSGFLGSALTTAAGVAGGLVAGNLLTNMLTGGHHMGESAWGEPAGGMAGNPWGAPAATDQGTWDNTGGGAAANQDYVDSGTWDQQPTQDSSWTDNSGGSWDTSGGDSGSLDSGGGDSGGGSDDSF